MSSIYEHLAKAEAEVNSDIAKKLPKIDPVSAPKVTHAPPLHRPRLFGFKLLVMFALLFSIGSAAASVYFFQAMNRAQDQSLKLQASLQNLTSATQSLSAASSASADRLIEITNSLQNLDNETSTLRSSLNRTRLDFSAMQQKVADLEGRGAAMELDIERIKRELFPEPVSQNLPVLATPVPRIVAAPQDVEKNENVLVAAQPVESSNEMNSSVGAVEAGLPPVRVMTVNRKFNFVVVNAGIKDNLRMGDRLEVKRGDQSIARVEIEKLYDDFSAATIVNEKKDFEIQEGDTIVLS